MEPNHAIADLIQANGGPCAIDKIHLPYEHAGSGPAAKFGLGAELFLSDPDRAKLRERSIEFLIDFWNMFPNRINEFLPDGSRRTKKFRGDPRGLILNDSASHSMEDGYGTMLSGAVDIGLPKDDVDPYQAHVLASRSSDPRLSFVSATMPICNDENGTNFDTLLSAVIRWCEICQPAHGSAGFTFIFSMSQNTIYALQMMKRFPGFNVQNGVDFTREANLIHNRIKCVNWLTVLSNDLVNELGGKDWMVSALEPASRIHEYAGGVVIQAGANPQLGDTWRNDIPEAYRLVARYTKAVRFEDYSNYLFRVRAGLDRMEETLAWVRRFD